MVTVFNVTVLVTYASATELSSNDLYFSYDSSSTSAYWRHARDFMNGKTTDISFCFTSEAPSGGTCATSILNKPFVMYSSAAFTGGWSCDVYVTYAYTKIL